MGSTIAAHEGSQTMATPTVQTLATSSVRGNDVSHWQGSINWSTVYSKGARFSYAKATEGTSYRDPRFGANYLGAYKAGLKHGAYHFALPNKSTGATQANYFADHGGAWSKDGKTLPGTLDIEYNPYGSTCYGKSQSAMRSWIASFINRYHYRTGRWAVI
ncbi:MAG: lysozyme, partial [Acidothermales bacterium]|nr:lysozyme [Acidothermales bacterium]